MFILLEKKRFVYLAKQISMINSLQLSNTEQEMFKEVFAVFDKYKSLTRTFGLQLVHSHFSINDDEVLLETNNEELRHLFVRPVKVTQLNKIPLATSWAKDNNGVIKISQFCCDGPDVGDVPEGPSK